MSLRKSMLKSAATLEWPKYKALQIENKNNFKCLLVHYDYGHLWGEAKEITMPFIIPLYNISR